MIFTPLTSVYFPMYMWTARRLFLGAKEIYACLAPGRRKAEENLPALRNYLPAGPVRTNKETAAAGGTNGGRL